MKKVTKKEWVDVAKNLTEWRKNRTSPPNLDLYKRIVQSVHVGKSVADIGCGQCHLEKCLPSVHYYGFDPLPIAEGVIPIEAERLIHSKTKVDTTFALSMLDNVRNLKISLEGIKIITKKNIVILTGIGIEPDKFHTVRVDRSDLTEILGEPHQEIEISKNLFLFEFLC